MLARSAIEAMYTSAYTQLHPASSSLYIIQAQAFHGSCEDSSQCLCLYRVIIVTQPTPSA